MRAGLDLKEKKKSFLCESVYVCVCVYVFVYVCVCVCVGVC